MMIASSDTIIKYIFDAPRIGRRKAGGRSKFVQSEAQRRGRHPCAASLLAAFFILFESYKASLKYSHSSETYIFKSFIKHYFYLFNAKVFLS